MGGRAGARDAGPRARRDFGKIEAILAEEVFDPAGWEEDGWYDTDDDGAGVAGALPNVTDAARRAIDPALVAGVLDVDAAAEKRRAARASPAPRLVVPKRTLSSARSHPSNPRRTSRACPTRARP